MNPETLRALAMPMLEKRGMGEDTPPQVAPLPGSSMQRTFKLHLDGLDYVLKWYPMAPTDQPDPWLTEQQFYTYLQQSGVHDNPFALGWDSESRLGLLSLLHGRAVRREEVDLPRTLSAAAFLARINQDRHVDEAKGLPGVPARESSIAAMLDAVNTFLLRGVPEPLRHIQPLTSFWEDEFSTGWHEIVQHCLSSCETLGMDASAMLQAPHAMITPGEFTFHNAIITLEHSLCFCDFDQARWGDPACIIARFFAQPDFQVKPAFLEEFLKAFSGIPDGDPLMAARLNLILPVIRIELALTTLFPNIQWEKGQLGFDPDQNGKVHLIQNLSQARQHLKAGLRSMK
ncbi:MAG: hypothetical protein P8L18_05290 [Verrucomicrobiota bacterium]|nr:hypothetical protein [Verrucomicrobiota bacterium]